MALLKCKMCGGSLSIDRAKNMAVCDYCGTSSVLYERDLQLYQQFEQIFASLLNQTRESTEAEEGFWLEAQEEEVVKEDGTVISIRYLFKQKTDVATMYVARKNVIYIFEEQCEKFASHYVQTVNSIVYPTPEMEEELKKYIPNIVMQCRLRDGGVLLAIEKPAGVYPLSSIGILVDRHVAWVISRLENLCCLLSYNKIVLQGIKLKNLFVDPATHQIYLYGGWWYAKKDTGTKDLEDLRLAAVGLLGYPDLRSLEKDTVLPEAFRKFLMDKSKKDAFDDFQEWDAVLMKSYGERRFIPLNIKEEMIYSKERGDR